MIEKIALKKKLITRAQYDEAVAACAHARDREVAYKEFFIAKKWLSDREISALAKLAGSLEIMRKDLKFGIIAVKLGYISKSVLELILEEQKKAVQKRKTPKLIGELLVESGMLTPKQRETILSEQLLGEQELAAAPAPSVCTTDTRAEQPAKPAGEQPLPEPVAQGGGTAEPVESSKREERLRMTQEDIGSGLILKVLANQMEAFLLKTGEFDEDITVEDVRELLLDRFIQFGIVDDNMIQRFILSKGFKSKGFMVARGVAPKQGRDAKIEFYFDTDHLKAGGLDEEGGIDFKERGAVPLVEAGVLLAEKIPSRAAVSGRDVFGEEHAMAVARDAQLKGKEGTRLSEDGLRLYSAVRGYPRLSWSGSVMVVEDFVTKGDVNYETGHVRYKGNVIVNGCIKDGFQVCGCDIRANEIEGGVVRADGNLVVAGGVNDADIYARGNVRVKFVHKSRIVCLGNVFIEAEIVDSSMESSGACIIEKGDIINCEISAKMGVSAENVDTGISRSSTITLGRDSFVESELKKIQGALKVCSSQIEQLKLEREMLVEEIGKLHEHSLKLAHELDRIQAEEGRTEAFLKLEGALNDCFTGIERQEIARDEADQEVSDLEDRVDDLSYEEENFREWSRVNPPKSVMVVDGTLYPGATVYGLHSKKIFKDKVTKSKICEFVEQDPSADAPIYRIASYER
ncbi:MAG: DUF342 domain-containing protein [Desulfobacteraceae bacterium]|nr:DUF342 domain-containing protein [Desulfobacteraceae bacterium]